MEILPMIENAKTSGTRVRHRLGVVGLPGFAPVPHLLLLHQRDLKITSSELNVFLNIFMHWHDAARLPYVHTATIARRMATSQRSVQRLINSLKKKGMVERVPGLRRDDPKRYDVRPLLLKLQPYAKEWVAHKASVTESRSRGVKEMFAAVTGVV